ncbi:MAG: hypothetical protein LBB10_01370, partial [Bifidobacteriaceae bacterium]|nr:hypothetical protein [Bifidobacteriaceae bacterium]
EKEHKKIGKLFAESGLDEVLIFLDSSKEKDHLFGEYSNFVYFYNKDAVIDYISKTAKKGDSILVKASNSSKLWEVIEGFEKLLKE